MSRLDAWAVRIRNRGSDAANIIIENTSAASVSVTVTLYFHYI